MSFFPASPWDYITSTKDGEVRFDGRRTFEFGSFWVTTAWGSVLIYKDQFTEWFFLAYLATWTTAKYLRDREQRLNKPELKP